MIKKCKYCGKGFEQNVPNQKYCSKTCRNKAHYQRRRENILAYYKKRNSKNRHKKVCPVCEKEFIPHNNNQKYCSKECAKKKQKKYSLKYYYQNKKRILESRKQLNREYPCYRYHESRIARIPDNMCLNCSAKRCRFDHDQ